MNLPNLLTSIRMALVPVFATLLLTGRVGWALIVFALAGITDIFDGYIARAYHRQTRLGALLDPLADKLLLVTAYLLLTALARVPPWLTAVVVGRDLVLLMGLGLTYRLTGGLYFSPTPAGKATTALQLITIAANLLGDFIAPVTGLLGIFYALTLALTLVSGVWYLYDGLRRLSTPRAHPEE